MKTVEKVCLRCDWEGETGSRTCPDCGTPLWLPNRPDDERARRGPLAWWRGRRRARVPTAEVVRTAPEVLPPSAEPLPSHPEIVRDESPEMVAAARDRRRVALTVGIVVVAALVVFAIIRAASPTPVDPVGQAVGGRLAYAIRDDADPQFWRIWIVDLSTGTYARGPRLLEPRSLARATQVSPDAVMSVAERSTGESADLLRFLGPDDEAVSLLSGDVAAWSPLGDEAAVADVRGGCAGIEVSTWDPTLARREGYPLETGCADLTSLVAAYGATYVTLEDQRGSTIGQVEGGSVVPIATGWEAVGASGRDLYVVPSPVGAAGPALAVLDGAPSNVVTRPVGAPREPFIFERFLAWGSGPGGDLVLGTYQGVRGVYRITEYHERPDPIRPIRVFETLARDVGATATLDGTVIVSVDGTLHAVHDSASQPITLPEDAPVPGTVMVWLPAEDTPTIASPTSEPS